MFKRFLPIAACAATLLLTRDTLAAFTYISTPAPATTTVGGSQVTLTGVSTVTLGTTPTFISLFKVADNTSSTVSDSFAVNFTDTIALTNIPGSGTSASGNLVFTGTINFTRSDAGGELSSLLNTPASVSLTIGGVSYTLSSITYTPPTVNSATGPGNVSGFLTASPESGPAIVPEPASIAMMGIGLVGVAALARRRRVLPA